MPRWTKKARKQLSLRMIGNKIKKGTKSPKSVCKKISLKTKGSNNPRWIGGRIIDKDGYVLIKNWTHPHRDKNKNYIREHRLIMETYIGRILLRSEVVHHINGIKHDNRIENLHLFTSNSEHTKHHLKERYAGKTKKTGSSSTKQTKIYD